MTTTPIRDLALLSDRHSSALVDRNGAVQWLAFPRFDSPSIVGGLLGEAAGTWWIRPRADSIQNDSIQSDSIQRPPATRRSLHRRHARARDDLHDADRARWCSPMRWPPAADNGGHRIGAASPHLLVRRLDVHGRRGRDRDLATRRAPSTGSSCPCWARSPAASPPAVAPSGSCSPHLELDVDGGTAADARQARAGETMHLGLHHSHARSRRRPGCWSAGRCGRARRHDRRVAVVVGAAPALRRALADLVHHSGRVLQALSFQPTGAIVAAATTSLPEGVGGERNWDYRYSWVRDASFTIEALWVAACPDEASTSSRS